MSATREYRDDLTGLRSVAVLLVVLFHAKVPGFRAGFIGVDIFFVLSGFLITSGLARQLDETGRIDVLSFWAARARRLLPAATAVIAATVVASVVILTPFAWRRVVSDAWAATFYFANVHFGRRDTSYFADQTNDSPLLHFWSLSIEEQWYLALPLVLSVAALWARRSNDRSPRSVMGGLMIAAVSGSFVLSATTSFFPQTPMTYLSPLNRAWELGAGGLLAIYGLPWLRRLGPDLKRTIGFGLVALSLTAIDPAAVFPGAIAILPVAGTLLIIDARGGRTGALESRPSVWLGEHSYSWYLWHWPALVLAEATIVRWTSLSFAWPTAALVATAALLPSAASRRWIEEPFRHSPRLVASRSATTVRVGAVVAMSAVLLVGAAGYIDHRFDQPELLAFSDALDDRPPLPPHCATSDAAILLERCATGSTDPDARRVLLIGDSHMANWAPAFSRAAGEHNVARPAAEAVQVVTALGGSCPVYDVAVSFERPWCTWLRAGTPETIEAIEPDTVIIGHRPDGYVGALTTADGTIIADADQLDTWLDALERFVDPLVARGIDVVLVQPTPTQPEHPLHCASLSDRPASCVADRSELEESIQVAADGQRARLANRPGVRIFDPIDVVCPQDDCPFAIDGEVVWTDTHHITASYAEARFDAVTRFLLPPP